jgi:hypothetical protein
MKPRADPIAICARRALLWTAPNGLSMRYFQLLSPSAAGAATWSRIPTVEPPRHETTTDWCANCPHGQPTRSNLGDYALLPRDSSESATSVCLGPNVAPCLTVSANAPSANLVVTLEELTHRVRRVER